MKKIMALCLAGVLFIPCVGLSQDGGGSPGLQSEETGQDMVGVTSKAGWDCYNRGAYICAESSFLWLSRRDDRNPEFLLGLCYSLQKLDRRDEALNLIASFRGTRNAEITRLYLDLNKSMGVMAYEAANYTEAEGGLAKAHRLDPSDEGIHELLLWTRYHLDQPEGLIEFLAQRYGESGSVQAAEDLLGVYVATGYDREAQHLAHTLGEQDSQAGNGVAGQYYYQNWGPVSGAQVDGRAGTCYENCDAVKLRGGFLYYAREGDKGFSQLDVFGLTIQAESTTDLGNIWNVRVSPLHLDSDSAGDHPYAGSFYRLINNPLMSQRSLVDSRMVYAWDIRFDKEGLNPWGGTVGTTPLNGVSSVMPTFSGYYRGASWEVVVEQSSVKESILSWIGQDDPYSNHSWGRVLKSGLSGRKTFELAAPYWLSVAGRYHYYWGENVEDNQGVGLSMSVGKTDKVHDYIRNLGFFSDVIHFQDNHSFYTYGHGGYYSPNLQFIIGPFARLTTEKCKSYWLDMEASVGYSWTTTDDAPHYRDPDLSGLDPSFLGHSDLTGSYAGEDDTDISINLKIRGMRHIIDNWYVAGSAAINNSSGYREIQMGAFLQYHFGQQDGQALCNAARQVDLLMGAIH